MDSTLLGMVGKDLPIFHLHSGGGSCTLPAMEIVLPIVLCVVIVAMAAGVVYQYLRSRPPKDEARYTFRCPKCRRKFHYRASRAGHRGICPSCRQHFHFPAAGAEQSGPNPSH
jgi:hypothetical protein